MTGLDEAILGSMNAKDPEQNAAKIAALLQNGAHALVGEAASTKASEDFANADISEILAQRTEKRQIGSRAGNTFSTAQFTAEPTLVLDCDLSHSVVLQGTHIDHTI